MKLIPAILLGLAAASPGFAQHDPERNSMQFVAKGQFDRIDEELAKKNSTESETLYVRMVAALLQGNTDEGVQLAQQALDAGLPFSRFVAGPRDALAPLYETAEYQEWAEELSTALIHGPMVGALQDGNASFWMRTAQASEVRVVIQGTEISGTAQTSAETDYTAIVQVSGLEPDRDYNYSVLVDGEEQTSATFWTYPEGAGKFRIGFGGGAGFVPDWERMWNTIDEYGPVAFLMLGDNVYIDQPEQPLTNKYCYYRRQSRPEWQDFTARRAIHAIYDDHDFGTNDCIPGPEIDTPAWKRPVWETFRQNWVNPSYGGGDENPGCWHDFTVGDVQFFLLDGRYYRDHKGGTMLGPVQMEWLKESILASDATFKVIASPVPFTPGIKPGSRDPWDGYPEERAEIFSFLHENRVEGVFLVAADRHRTDLRRIPREDGGYELMEFESSRLTNRHTHPVVKTPGLVWGYKDKCSFALMDFDTTAEDPQVTFQAIDIDGTVHHTQVLRLSEVSY